MLFESVPVGVSLSSTTGFHESWKLRADEFEARIETQCQTPRMDIKCGRARFGVQLQSLRLAFYTTSSDMYRNLRAGKSRHETKLGAKYPEWSSYMS